MEFPVSWSTGIDGVDLEAWEGVLGVGLADDQQAEAGGEAILEAVPVGIEPGGLEGAVPGEHAALEDVDLGEPGGPQEGRGLLGAGPGGADQDQGLLPCGVQLADALGELIQREEEGAGEVALAAFRPGTDVNPAGLREQEGLGRREGRGGTDRNDRGRRGLPAGFLAAQGQEPQAEEGAADDPRGHGPVVMPRGQGGGIVGFLFEIEGASF
jgi:hypothetical protein